MGKSTPAAPPPPDPFRTAAAQTQGDVQSAIASGVLKNANTYGPTGSTVYNRIGTEQIRDAEGNLIDVPRYESRTTLSPEQQQLYDQQTRLGSTLNGIAETQAGRIGSLLNSPIDVGSLPSRGDIGYGQGIQHSFADSGPIQKSVGADDFSVDRQRVEDALFSRLEPKLAGDRAALDARLLNQGLTSGGTAYREAIDETNRTATDARMAAILAGGQEQSRMFGMDLSKGQFANAAQEQQYGQDLGRASFHNQAQGQWYGQASDRARFADDQRARALQETLALRNQPINEITALMGGGQVSMPQFTPYQGSGVAGSSVGSNIYNSAAIQQQQYQQQLQQQNAMMGGLFGLGSAAVKAAPFFSDRRLKRDITPLGSYDNGLTIYGYRYLWSDEPRLGFMADEVEKVMPEAVGERNGFKTVNYGLVMGIV